MVEELLARYSSLCSSSCCSQPLRLLPQQPLPSSQRSLPLQRPLQQDRSRDTRFHQSRRRKRSPTLAPGTSSISSMSVTACSFWSCCYNFELLQDFVIWRRALAITVSCKLSFSFR